MRITGGKACGLKISTLSGRDVRPTSDRVREALFQILTVKMAYDWSGVCVLDLFAGSGSLGIEALSRGAEYAVFADFSRRSLECVKKNLEKTGFWSCVHLIRLDMRRPSTSCRILSPLVPFDLVLADPPYSRGFPASVLTLSASMPLVARGGILVIEEFSRARVPSIDDIPGCTLTLEDIRRYGQTSLYFFRQMH